MKALIQRVSRAQVQVGDEIVSTIGRGLCVLIGICRDDTSKDAEYIVRKILNTRLFDDGCGKRWSQSVKDKGLEILCVSQFTLYHTLKGNKPDFHNAMSSENSEKLYLDFLDQLRKQYNLQNVKDGRFGAYMQVDIQNDGPVTVLLESPTSNPVHKTLTTKDKIQ